ncbi:hypothetical protein FGSG_13105 [Fusarium graminearum PH-1]|uniref:Chromosome 4, complete genome n=1 Tax=Gibberella zeae (strain ATCC MYA-4620 / CBS 123657 / FGSC 9075 / NRRL 31084 / PH-1) TaxID=229533 RepID=I1S8C7_GIBZE|nr:hypothetical protein FGSG_13105 [Fusarium graminearum PH-1]ESU13474.1 hypothetical protein FGSG_13105 [Fusarium graminearum PH-1]EYB27569.1 hypothetical protein FG05_13105 [Fusarium graminearum]CEF84377.1 unnamed protein product [Fusarium graminearum]|eukprot:XP_011326981.1 hypothetical protein FGSG_13105 [Fusarium graminearum PH-1]
MAWQAESFFPQFRHAFLVLVIQYKQKPLHLIHKIFIIRWIALGLCASPP